MKNFGKIALGVIFSILFSSFILLTTVKFELLNKSFLFETFENHRVYEKLPGLLTASLPNDPNLSEEEQLGYVQIVKNISPALAREIIETNLGQIIDYINGDVNDINISFAFGQEKAQWSLSNNAPKDLQQQIRNANGFGNSILGAIIIVFLLLSAIFVLYGRLTTPRNWLGGKTLLLTVGINITLISIILRLGMLVIGKELDKGIEPSQKLLGLLSSSLLPPIVTTWMIIGVLLILTWLILKIFIEKFY